MNILETIMAERLADAKADQRDVPPADLKAQAAARRHHSLAARLAAGGGPCIIAEMKKASPSAGVLSWDYRPADIARAYQRGGAGGLSVLTEPRHFLGAAAHLREARAAVDLPILRKDFIGDPYQVAEAAAWGADVVLLIVAALARESLLALHDAAKEYGLEVLAEAHTEDEAATALSLEGAIIGVNSRDLKTLKTDLAVARRLARMIPRDRLSVAESGIRTAADIAALRSCGYKGFLIGETLMRDGKPGARLAELLGHHYGPNTVRP